MAATISAERCTPTIAGAETRFHLSLNVADLLRSVDFFRQFFGIEPASQHADYAKFELQEPPLVLSLGPRRLTGVGALNHVGFRLPDTLHLIEIQRRLESAGISTLREEGVACCHSTQTKFWVHDPDGNLWEIYTLDAEAAECERRPASAAELPVVALSCATSVASRESGPAPAISAHRLDQPLPAEIFAPSDSVDQVQLHGTFNADVLPGALAAFLAEVARVLKDGGEVLTHLLAADAPLSRDPLELPGIARLVAVSPPVSEVIDLLAAAGLTHAELTVLAPTPNFVVGGIGLRECKLRAVKSTPAADAQGVTIVYRGPFAELREGAGQTYHRGRPTVVDSATAERLRQSSAADLFVFFDAD